jgi:S1-C subfamily serine protease
VVSRAGVEKTFKVIAIEREPMEMKTSELKQWGMTARNLSLLAAKELKRENREGVFITSIRPGGPCGGAKPQVEQEDIIVSVAGKPVSKVEDLVAITKEITAGKKDPVPALVEFERKSEKYLTVVKVGIQELEDPGAEFKKAWLDVSTQVLTRQMAEQLGVADKTGVRVTDVHKKGKAAQAGLKTGDLIIAVDGDAVVASNPEDNEVFPNMIRQYKIGAVVELTVLRSGKEEKIKTELVRAPMQPREMKKYRNENFEFTVREIAFQDKTDEKLEDNQPGVYVEEVKSGGWASVGQLNTADLIVEAFGEKIADLAAFEKVMKKVEVEKPKSLVLHVVRGIRHIFIELEPDWGKGAAPARALAKP